MQGTMARSADGTKGATSGATGKGLVMVGNASAPTSLGASDSATSMKRKRSKANSKTSQSDILTNKGSTSNASAARKIPSSQRGRGASGTGKSSLFANGSASASRSHSQLESEMTAKLEGMQLETRARSQSSSRSPTTTHSRTQQAPPVSMLRGTQAPAAKMSLSRHASQDNDTVLMRASVPYSDVFPVKEDRVGPHHFKKLKLLGRGGIGKVFLVLLKGTEKLYAMKVLTKEEMIQRNKVKRVMTEREILATANHPFIVTMYASFQTVDRLCFVMEYCEGGEFFRVLQQQPKKRLKEDAVRFYAAEVTLALEYLHHLGFIYRDLKPENILMRADGHIALTDFDLSKQAHAIGPRVLQKDVSVLEKLRRSMSLKRQSSSLNNLEIVDVEPVLPYQTNSFVGTEEYISPEVVRGVGQSATVDWWTLGILIYEMLTGTTPFKGSYTDETFSNIVNHKVKWPDDVYISPEGKRLVDHLLKRDSRRRLGAENGASDIKRQKWFKDFNFDLIRNETPPIIPKIRDPKDMAASSKFPQEEETEEVFDDANPNNVFPHFYIRRDSEVQRQY